MIDHDGGASVAEPVRSTHPRVDGDGWTGLVPVTELYDASSVAVMPTPADADDRTVVTTMQRFNGNPAFQVSSTAALVLTALAAFPQRRHGCGTAALHGRGTVDPTVRSTR